MRYPETHYFSPPKLFAIKLSFVPKAKKELFICGSII